MRKTSTQLGSLSNASVGSLLRLMGSSFITAPVAQRRNEMAEPIIGPGDRVQLITGISNDSQNVSIEIQVNGESRGSIDLPPASALSFAANVTKYVTLIQNQREKN